MTEHWAFCAGMATGLSIFFFGVIVGAFMLYKYVVFINNQERERRLKQHDEMRKTFSKAMKKNKDEPL
jgi:uncharacterized membrane protein (DUF106 family)